ncbi:hypothetical protein H0H81_000886 [Sphagnurus paluster]|uniref:Uncharacterized protein n=1 Tax=Sphagnurus paluster TaxID=117069 RepID=A0A9P7K3B6_9AGAR|nr:hypothetical protein H0H81_000886 [Sphagnurus paluster]
MTTNIPQESPPSYDVATDNGLDDNTLKKVPQQSDVKPPLVNISEPVQLHSAVVGPSYTIQPGYTQMPQVHHYINPSTGEQVASLLPPDHPEMVCLQAGMHIPETKYGLLGM